MDIARPGQGSAAAGDQVLSMRCPRGSFSSRNVDAYSVIASNDPSLVFGKHVASSATSSRIRAPTIPALLKLGLSTFHYS